MTYPTSLCQIIIKDTDVNSMGQQRCELIDFSLSQVANDLNWV